MESTDETFVKSLLVQSILTYQWRAYGFWVGFVLFALHIVTFVALEVSGPRDPGSRFFLGVMALAILVAELSQVVELRAMPRC